MPDDNPLAGSTPAKGSTGNVPGNGADPAGGETPLTMAGAAELITQALSPMAQRLEELSQANAQLFQNLQSQAANQPRPASPALSEPPEDFLTEFSENPEKAIDTRIGKQLQQVAPLVSSLINTTVSNFVSRESEKIDREFGSGAYAKFIEKPLGAIMDSYRKSNATALADSGTITKEVNGLKGQLLDELVSHREESKKAATEAEEGKVGNLVKGVTEKVLQTNLTGGLRRIDGAAEEITESLKGYLAEREAAIGTHEDPKEFLARTDYGNTYEDFLAHQKKMSEAAGGK